MIVALTPAYRTLAALAYIVSVATLQTFFLTLTGWESQLAVAVSTLAIAVLLDPPRRRIQAFKDRQFQQLNL